MGVGRVVYRLLFVVICLLFRCYRWLQQTWTLLTNLFYNRQLRHKVLRFLRVDEDQVLARTRLLEKLPKQVVLSISLPSEQPELTAGVLQNLVVWASRLSIQEVAIFTLSGSGDRLFQMVRSKVQELCQDPTSEHMIVDRTSVTVETLKTFHRGFLEKISTGNSSNDLERHQSPMVLLFNNSGSVAGTPFPYLKSGELLFVGPPENYTVLDFEESLKQYSETRQRCGK